jgi:HlyD family secretion protein
MMRRLRWLPVAGVAALLVWRLAAFGGDEGEWTRVARRDLVISVTGTGTLRAVDAARLGPPRVRRTYTFKISMMAPEGTTVTAGTPVIAFDATELQQRLQTAATELESVSKQIEKHRIDLAKKDADDQLRLAEADARLRTARLLAQRPPELVADIEYQKNALDLDSAGTARVALEREIALSRQAVQAEIAALESDLERATNKVRELEASLRSMTVLAPRDGLVIYTTDWQGNKMKVGDTCWRDRKPVEIPDLSRMVGDAEVAEAEAGHLKLGQPVRLRLDAHPDVEHTGTVAELSRVVQKKSFTNPLRVVRLEIDLDRTDPETMRPAMRFRAEIETDRIEQVLVIPLQSIHVTADGPVVLRRGTVGTEATRVKLGRRNRSEVEVLEGLEEGDSVKTAFSAGSRRS